jgi:hypothetical protein
LKSYIIFFFFKDVGKDLEVVSIGLELGSRDERVLTMYWKGDCRNALNHENYTKLSFSHATQSSKMIKDVSLTSMEWNLIKVSSISQ